MADSKYTTIQQHEPLRVPGGWNAQERALIAQLETLFDDLYRRFNRLRLSDLGEPLRNTITSSAEGLESVKTEIEQTESKIALKLDKNAPAVGVNNSAITIDTAGIHLNSEGIIDVDGGVVNIQSGASLTMQAATDEDATVNGGAIWHGNNLVVSTSQPANAKKGMVWLQPYEEDDQSADAEYYNATWTGTPLTESHYASPRTIICQGVPQGAPPAGNYSCQYTVKVYFYKKPGSAYYARTAHVYLSSTSGGMDVDCGERVFTESGWFERTVTSPIWLGNSETIYITVVKDTADFAIYKNKPFSINASLSAKSEETIVPVSGFLPCRAYYYTGDPPPVSLSAPADLLVNGASSSTGSTCELTWTASELTNAIGPISYYVYKDGEQVAVTTGTSYTLGSSDISDWSAAEITVKAYNNVAGYSEASNPVTFTYKSTTTTVTVAASKYARNDNSSLANTGTTTCNVGRATSSSVVGTAMRFDAPVGGWGQYTKAVLHIQRTGGSASANVEIGKLGVPYSDTLYTTQFYYGNYGTNIGNVDVAGGTGWFELDISEHLPESGEIGITLMSKNAYITVDGTNAYIQLSA